MQSSRDFEYLTPIGYGDSTKCGYCGGQDLKSSKRFSYYANAVSISPKFYQMLLDRYWRRSGKLLYRPNQRESCCPHYTIRLDSGLYKPTRDQRQALNRFNRFILGESYMKEAARTCPRTRSQAKKRDNEFCLIERVHEAEYATLCSPSEPAHKLVVSLENDEFSEEKFLVYDNYQKVVHREDEKGRSRSGFKRFLCDSPLRRQSTEDHDGRKLLLGSYHHCYRIDGKLVAVGVIDLLPECVSSVYFLYHESIQKFSPGKLGALFEIALALERGCRWWYPGFYIHNCAKMRYKIDYAPQFILDPQALKWDPLCKEMLRLLDEKAFVSLAMERQSAEKKIERPEASQCPDQPGALSEAEATAATAQADDNVHEYGEDDDAKDAAHSLFRSNMPGIPSLREMKQVDLSNIALRLSPELPLFKISDLTCWKVSEVTDTSSIKGSVAELVAAVGPDLIDSICLEPQA